MQRGKRSRGGAGKVVRPAAKAAAPAQHPEGVLDIAAVAAGIDVHKMGLTVTLLSEDAGGEVLTETRAYRTYGRELEEFATWLAGWQPGRVMMESTGVYWKCIHSALERHGVSAWVVNARHVKRVPGRKDDVTDSVWLATLARYGLARPSFVPDARLEELRQLTRLHTRLRGVATKLKGMLHRLLDESGIRLGGILTDVLGVSGQRLLEGLAEGHDPEAMLLGVKGRARKKLERLRDALQQGLPESAKPLLRLLRGQWQETERALWELERRILETAKREWKEPWQRADAQGEPLSAADPVRDRACGGAHEGRAVRAAEEGPDGAARRPAGDRCGGTQDSAHRVRDAARPRAVQGSGPGLRPAAGAAQPGALGGCPEEGQAAARGRGGDRRSGRNLAEARIDPSRARERAKRGSRLSGRRRYQPPRTPAGPARERCRVVREELCLSERRLSEDALGVSQRSAMRPTVLMIA